MKMKDSGVEWIGEIPEEWEMKKVRYFLKEVSEKKHPNEQVLSLYRDYGVIPKDSRDDNHNVTSSDTSGYKFVEVGNLVINKMKAWQGSLAISNFQGIISPAYFIYRILDSRIDLRFLHYALRNPAYKQEYMRISSGLRVGQWDLNKEEFKNLFYTFPEQKEQQKIADFLDSKIALIDQIIADTKRSIEELKAYKQSLITETVTKGLDPNVPMKDSGVEWIGEIPEGWKVNKIKRLFEITKTIAFSNDFPVLSITQQGLKVKDTENNAGQMASDYSKYQIVKTGYFAMNHMDLLTGGVDYSRFEFDGVTSPDYRVFRISQPEYAFQEYYLYIFKILYWNKIFYGEGQGVSNLGRWRLQADKFNNFYIPTPPLKIQKDIVDFLNKEVSQIESLIDTKQLVISEYEDYKKSLIYEYVTGKKRVYE